MLAELVDSKSEYGNGTGDESGQANAILLVHLTKYIPLGTAIAGLIAKLVGVIPVPVHPHAGFTTQADAIVVRSDLTNSVLTQDISGFLPGLPTLPFGTKVRVTYLKAGQSVEVIINDRGPHAKSRIIDLSGAAAKKIGLIDAGHCKVRLEIVEP